MIPRQARKARQVFDFMNSESPSRFFRPLRETLLVPTISHTLAGGRHNLQRRSNENERQQISRARKILCDLFPLPGDPFHNFTDGYGILFHVEVSAVQRTTRAWDDTEHVDEDAVPTGAGQFNPEDLEGFSIHST